MVESVWGRATPAVEERAQQAFLRQTGAGGAYGVYPPFNTLSPSSLFAQAQGSNWGEGPGWVNLGLQYEGEPGTRPLSAAWALPGALLSTESAQSGEVALGDTTPAMGPLLGELETHTTDLNAGPTRPVGGAALVGARSLLGEAHTGAVLSEGVYTMPVEVRTTLRAAAVALVEGGGPEVVTPLVIPMGGAEEQTAMVWHNNPYQALAQGLEPNPLGLELLEWAPKAPTSAQSWEGWGAATSFQLMAPLAATLPAPFDDLDPVYAGTR